MILKTFRDFEGVYSDRSAVAKFQLAQQDVTRGNKIQLDAAIFLV